MSSRADAQCLMLWRTRRRAAAAPVGVGRYPSVPKAVLSLVVALALLPIAVTSPADGQQLSRPDGDSADRRQRGPSALLPADHWAVRAAWRAEAMGLVTEFLPAQRSVAQHEVARALWQAAEAAGGRSPGVASLTEGWRARFSEEFPGAAARMAGESPSVLEMTAAAGVQRRSDWVAPGTGIREDSQVGAIPLSDRTSGFAALSGSAALGRVGVLEVSPILDGDELRHSRADLRVRLGPMELAAGRHPVGYGTARGGTVVLSGAAPLNRMELQTAAPTRLPSFLGVLGPVSFQTMLSALNEERHEARDPMFWGASVSLQPHPRLSVSVQRAAMFGGRGEHGDGDFQNFLWMLIGRVEGAGFENQQVSVEGRLRLPTESVLPLVTYFEWGTEDAAGAWWDVPGLILGLYAPAIPSLPQLALGAELTDIFNRCCQNPPWYRHSAFPGSWASGDVALGHPLGGEGREYLVYGDLDLLESRLRLEGRAFHRDRSAENLFAPGRGGSSRGGSLNAVWRFLPGSELMLRADLESGDGWSAERLNAGARVFF